MNFNFSKEFIIQYFVTNLFILAACCACYLIYDFCALVAEPKRLEKEMAARKRAKEMQIQESMPSAADVRPVKEGHWIIHRSDLFPADSTIECDQCHAEQPIWIDDNFCPACGADMRGEQHG